MQYYTKQQLLGATRYTGKCRVGNWNEDVEQSTTLLKDFLQAKGGASLKLTAYQARLSRGLEPVATKLAQPGLVSLGDTVCITGATGAAVAVDPEDSDPRDGSNCAVTAAPDSAAKPCARIAFTVCPYIAPASAVLEGRSHGREGDAGGESALRFGMKYRLVASAACDATPDAGPIALASFPITEMYYSKKSRNQEVVGLRGAESYDSVWTVAPIDPSAVLACEGLPVPAGEPVLLKHCATNSLLYTEEAMVKNDFGAEYAISCKVAGVFNKVAGVINMAERMIPEHLSAKAADSANYFMFTG